MSTVYGFMQHWFNERKQVFMTYSSNRRQLRVWNICAYIILWAIVLGPHLFEVACHTFPCVQRSSLVMCVFSLELLGLRD